MKKTKLSFIICLNTKLSLRDRFRKIPYIYFIFVALFTIFNIIGTVYIVKFNFEKANLCGLYMVTLIIYLMISTIRLFKNLFIDLKSLSLFYLTKIEKFTYFNLSIILDLNIITIVLPAIVLVYLISRLGIIVVFAFLFTILLFLFLLNSIIISIYLLSKILFKNSSIVVALIPLSIIIFQVMYRVFSENSFLYFPVSNFVGIAVYSILKSNWTEWFIMCGIMILILTFIYSANFLLLNNEKIYK